MQDGYEEDRIDSGGYGGRHPPAFEEYEGDQPGADGRADGKEIEKQN